MEVLFDIINQIKSTHSRKEKEKLIHDNKDNELFIKALQCAYSPYHKSNIGKKSLNRAIKDFKHTENIGLDECIDKILNKDMTSSNKDLEYCANVVYSHKEGYRGLIRDIICQDLVIGVGVSTINKGLGCHLIDEIKPMLGTQHTKAIFKGEYIVTEKHDGVRRLVVKNKHGISAFSRNGIEYQLPKDMYEEFKLVPNGVYDGELLAVGNFKDNHEQRQMTNSLASRKDITGGLEFVVFDYITTDDFFGDDKKVKAIDRKIQAINIFNEDCPKYLDLRLGESNYKFKHIRTSPILGIVDNLNDALQITESIWNDGGEGTMLLATNSLYKNGRSKDLIKIKNIEGYDLPIVDLIEGEGQFKGSLGALVVDYKGYKVGVGTGFNNKERQKLWDNRDKLIGIPVEVESLGETKDKEGNLSLHCPVYKGLRVDKMNI